MKKIHVCTVIMAWLCACESVQAAEFTLIDETIAWNEKKGGFYLWKAPQAGPTNWLSPHDYFNGRVHARFEVIEQPTKEPFRLSFCIWGKAATGQPASNYPESASPIGDALSGPGSVATIESSPSTWWRHSVHGGVNFQDRGEFLQWGIPFWASKNPNVLAGLSREHWAKRADWLPLKLRVTVVAVSEGSTFSGWTNYVSGGTR